MPEPRVSPQLLEDLIERRLSVTPAMGETAALARLAFDCGGIVVAGPDALARDRMRARFAGTIMDGRRRRALGWFATGIGAQGLQRKLAAAALAATVVGGATSYSTGVSPFEAIDGVAGFVRSVAVNLLPNDGGGSGGLVTPTATPSPSPAARPAASPSPATGATTAPAGTQASGSQDAQEPASPAGTGQPSEPGDTPEAGQIGEAATPEPTPTPTATARVEPTPQPTVEADDPPETVTSELPGTPSPSPTATAEGDDDPEGDSHDDEEDDDRLGSGRDRGEDEEEHD